MVNAVIAPEGGDRWLEYAGAIPTCWRSAAMILRARRQAAVAERSEGLQPPHEPAPARRRLSFHEKHALETLPKTIAALQAKVRALHERLDDPALYARDRRAFDGPRPRSPPPSRTDRRRGRWLELEILREEVAGR